MYILFCPMYDTLLIMDISRATPQHRKKFFQKLIQIFFQKILQMNQTNQKKKLRLNAEPFNPTSDPSQLQQPYAPVIQTQPFYPQPYQNFQNPQYLGQGYNPIPPQQFVTQPYQQQFQNPIPQKPLEQEKPKKKPLQRSAKPFETDNDDKKKKEQEEKEKELEKQRQEQQEQERQQQLLKQQEEDRIKQEQIKERQPRAYNQSEMHELLARYELEDFEYFQQAQWRIILGRKVHEIKDRESKNNNRNNQPRKSTNQYVNNQRTPQQPKENNVQFSKGTNVQTGPPPPQQKTQTGEIQIYRRVEDVSTKIKRDHIRTNLDWFNKQKENEDEKQTIKKDIKFWLNIISPDNYEMFADKLVKALQSNPELSDYFADRILEKSQTESKYREIYSNLCSKLAKDTSQLNQTSGKQVSAFRSSILDRVQKGFEQRKMEQQQAQNLTAEQKAQFHAYRKNRIMGNVRFIGDLYKKQVLPQRVVNIAFQELISDFLEQFDPKHKDEEEIEGIVELLDQIGQYYETSKGKSNNNVQNFDDAELREFLNGNQKSKVDIAAFFKKYEKVTSLDFMFRILHIVKKQYNISVRVSILIDNLDDRRNKGWKETIHQQGESAKSTSQIQQESLQQEQKDRERQPSYVPKKQPVQKQQQYVEYVAKNQQSEEVDYSEMSQRIEIAFKLKSTDPQVLSDELKDSLKNVGKDAKGQQVFFEEFFKRILKASKQNLERAQIVQTLVASDLTILDAVLQSSKKIFSNEDLVYDLMDSPYGAELFVDIIVNFLNEEMYEQLNYLYFRPPDDNEEYQEFFTKVILELIKDVNIQYDSFQNSVQTNKSIYSNIRRKLLDSRQRLIDHIFHFFYQTKKKQTNIYSQFINYSKEN
ncbi:hypothetical protein pb186bvf_012046 [Paramecium bursaria]